MENPLEFQPVDPRLDRFVQYDERSRNFPIAAVVPEDVKTRTWYMDERLDQGREGACVGFAWTHELASRPYEIGKLDNSFARDKVYFEAQKIDPWPGGAYPGASPFYEGTSVLAGAKTVQRLGYIGQYRWCFSVDDILRALTHEGPVIMGTWWLGSMFRPRPSGILEVDTDSDYAGGHAYMLRGVTLKPRIKGERGVGPVVRVTNSWGRDWGVNGEAYLRVEDLEWLLHEDGEACVPLARARPVASTAGVTNAFREAELRWYRSHARWRRH